MFVKDSNFMTDVVSCILMNSEGMILILKRSDKVRTYKGLWSSIAGYVEKDEEPLDTTFKEIREEVGLSRDDVTLVRRGDHVKFSDVYEGEIYNWKIFPFLFKTEKKDKVQIDWEHTNYRWVYPSDIDGFDTVPHFNNVVSNLLM